MLCAPGIGKVPLGCGQAFIAAPDVFYTLCVILCKVQAVIAAAPDAALPTAQRARQGFILNIFILYALPVAQRARQGFALYFMRFQWLNARARARTAARHSAAHEV